jgi:peptide/nickel transport system substrate-binding protein
LPPSALSASLLAAACSGSTTSTNDNGTGTGTGTGAREGSSTDKAAHKQGGSVTIANTQGQTWTCQFNPFNPAVNPVSLGFVYEPLVYVNLLEDQKETPMLASSYQWNADKTSIVFTIRRT